MTPHLKSNFDEMFSKAVASIASLQFVNKAQVTPEERRGAEYDIWKKYALDWLQATKLGADALREFYKKHRTYLSLVNSKYQSVIYTYIYEPSLMFSSAYRIWISC